MEQVNRLLATGRSASILNVRSNVVDAGTRSPGSISGTSLRSSGASASTVDPWALPESSVGSSGRPLPTEANGQPSRLLASSAQDEPGEAPATDHSGGAPAPAAAPGSDSAPHGPQMVADATGDHTQEVAAARLLAHAERLLADRAERDGAAHRVLADAEARARAILEEAWAVPTNLLNARLAAHRAADRADEEIRLAAAALDAARTALLAGDGMGLAEIRARAQAGIAPLTEALYRLGAFSPPSRPRPVSAPAPAYAPPPVSAPAPAYAPPPVSAPAPAYAPPPVSAPAPAYAPPPVSAPPNYAPPPATAYTPPPTAEPSVYAPAPTAEPTSYSPPPAPPMAAPFSQPPSVPGAPSGWQPQAQGPTYNLVGPPGREPKSSATEMPANIGLTPEQTRMARYGSWMRNTGVFTLLFVAFQLWGTDVSHAQSQRRLRAAFVEVETAAAAAAPDGDQQAAVAEPPVRVPRGDAIAMLEIPAVGVEQAVVEGIGLDSLKRGPGHYSRSAFPGQAGNVAIAGHRTTFGAPFNRLDELVPGDVIRLTTRFGRITYEVAETRIVLPSETKVLAATADDRLTLTTCHPKYSMRQRLVVVAKAAIPVADQLADSGIDTPAPDGVPASGPLGDDAPAEAGTDPDDGEVGLGGDAGATAPTLAWAALFFGGWKATDRAGSRWGRRPILAVGIPVGSVMLYQMFSSLNRLLPAAL
ncbi:MAG: class E sortase [Acidimicrobiales bacterium]